MSKEKIAITLNEDSVIELDKLEKRKNSPIAATMFSMKIPGLLSAR